MGFSGIVGPPSLLKRPTNTAQNTIRPADIFTPGITVTGVNQFQSTTADHYVAGESFPRVRINPKDGVWTGDGTADPKITYGSKLVNLYGALADSQPRLALDASTTVPAMKFGPGGTTAADYTIQRQTSGGGLEFRLPPLTSNQFAGARVEGIQIMSNTGVAGTAIDGTNGGTMEMVMVWPNIVGGNHGTRNGGGATAGSILTDAAYPTGFSSGVGVHVMNMSSGTTFDEIGACVHFMSHLTVDPYPGGTDSNSYCEASSIIAIMNTNRKGCFSANAEMNNKVASGTPARVAVCRLILEDDNTNTAYNSTNFGAGSRYISTGGAMGLEIISQGAGNYGGTGISFWGSKGWRSAIGVFTPGTTTLVSGIDGLGGVFTRTKAGAPVDGDFRNPVNGLMVVNTSDNKLYWRSGGTWHTVTGTVT